MTVSGGRGIFGLFLFFATILNVTAQGVYKPLAYPGKIPSNYLFNPARSVDDLNASIRNSQLSTDEFDRFSEMIIDYKKETFSTGEIYFNWEKAETYLNSILQRLLPDSLKNKSNIHVYIRRDTDCNVGTLDDGTILFNVGELAEATSEAVLAAILGHEFTHYLHRDGYRSCARRVCASRRWDYEINSEEIDLSDANYSREMEHDADSLGLEIALSAGYNVSELNSYFYDYLIGQEIYEKNHRQKHVMNVGSKRDSIRIKREKDRIDLLSDHPETASRIDFIKHFGQNNERNKTTQKFLVNENLFWSVRQQARYERLSTAMQNLEFYDCILFAFEYHLYDPKDVTYLYYLLDGIRKLVYTENHIAEEGFLNRHLRNSLKPGQGILHRPDLLFTDSSKMRNVMNPELLDTRHIAFENYSQAFDYFFKKAIEMEYTEAYLIAAQWNIQNKDLRKTYCMKYLENPTAQYRDYATSLLKGGLESDLKENKKEFFLTTSFGVYEKYNDGLYPRMFKSQTKSPVFLSAFDTYLKRKYPGKEIILLDSLKEKNLQDYMLYMKVFENSLALYENLKAAKTKKKEIYFEDTPEPEKKEGYLPDVFVLDQDTWYFFKENKLSTLEYLSTATFEFKTKIHRMLARRYTKTNYLKYNMKSPVFLTGSEQNFRFAKKPRKYARSVMDQIQNN